MSHEIALLATPTTSLLKGGVVQDSKGKRDLRIDMAGLFPDVLPQGEITVEWGKYEPAIRRWERITGVPAPCPVEPGTKGNRRLAPPFPEWMMGLPPGWVTDVPGLTRSQQLRAIGNGVVPQQVAAAVRDLLGPAVRDA